MREYIIPIDDQTVTDHPTHRALGTSILTLPEGKALCTDAVSLTSITAEDDDGQFIIVIAVASFEGQHLGSLSPMTPNEARNFAASMIQAANLIDGGANG